MHFSLLILLIAASLASMSTQALRVSQCFAYADSFYEHVYCEIQADIPNTNLPDFWQFKKNNQQMQFLLLKRYAQQLSISLPRPSLPEKQKKPSTNVSESTKLLQSKNPMAVCQLTDNALSCGKNRYFALGNLNNNQLSPGVLEHNFQLNLPLYDGSTKAVTHKNTYNSELISYLKRAYAIYLNKMIAIGLAAETFSFNKFAYFFEEHEKKGMNFSHRFEKMFTYLKNDKKKLGVNTKISIPQTINTKYCVMLKKLASCSHEGRNYIFKKNLQ